MRQSLKKRKSLRTSFCHCIKSVRKIVKAQKSKESAAIAICVKSVLQTRGKTLKKFRCTKKPFLQTQPIQ
uniref:Uncharacterized protein n=1 Tax=viral metagenome TaxID=1070528 RepID=A0A6C0KU06_9ZZZZ